MRYHITVLKQGEKYRTTGGVARSDFSEGDLRSKAIISWLAP